MKEGDYEKNTIRDFWILGSYASKASFYHSTFIGLLSHAKTGGAGYSMYNGMKASLSILALVIAAVAVLPVPVSATADPLTITATTTLTADHSGSIIIGANGITLDCAGHSVTGSGSGNGIFLSGRTGVTVKNCEVTNFSIGFRLAGFSSGNTLTGNTANDNGDKGFRLVQSDDNTLTRNTANDNGDKGFSLFESSDNTLTKNDGCNNVFFDAVQDGSSTDNVFVKNKFCTTSGI